MNGIVGEVDHVVLTESRAGVPEHPTSRTTTSPSARSPPRHPDLRPRQRREVTVTGVRLRRISELSHVGTLVFGDMLPDAAHRASRQTWR